MQRIYANRETPELYETSEILRKVRDNYLKAFDKLKEEEHIAVINGNRDINEVAADVWRACYEHL
jgi:thymidylate kinase